MKEKLMLAVLAILTITPVYGQNTGAVCNCPKTMYAGTKPDAIFRLSGGKTIVLCGYRNPKSNPINFSEFVLAVCGQRNIINFWDATTRCRIEAVKDTLLVKQLAVLPTGKAFKFQENVWLIEKIYFKGQKLVRIPKINRNIKKYNLLEIKSVLKTYEIAKNGVDEAKMEMVSMLFVAAISGNVTARKYFKSFETKFGLLDGDFAEQYSDLTSMLVLWDRK